MALSKTLNQTLAIPSRFRDYRFAGYVADEAAGANAGKLALTFQAAALASPSLVEQYTFSGFLEDVPDAVLTPTQRANLRKHLKKALAYWQEQAGATGTPDADPSEPT